MTLAETIYQRSLYLSEPAARQVLTLIQTLEKGYRVTPPVSVDTDDTEAFLAAVAGTLSDDFPDDITDHDLGVDAPREALD